MPRSPFRLLFSLLLVFSLLLPTHISVLKPVATHADGQEQGVGQEAGSVSVPTPPPAWPEMDGLTLPQYTPSFDQPKEPEPLRLPAPQPQPEQSQSVPVGADEQLPPCHQ